MTKRLKLVIIICALIMAGCQYNQGDIPVFTEKQSLLMQDISVDKTFILEDITLVGIGDSLTQGVGDERKLEGYLGRLSLKMKNFTGVREVEVLNKAKRGKRSNQLLSQLKSGELDDDMQNADFIVMTIGGNDIMRIVKQNLFRLRVDAFELELVQFTDRYNSILKEIRKLNPKSPIILLGLYNPVTILTDEENEFDEILMNWNQALTKFADNDSNACFVQVDDLFNSNMNMVYHTDFFHPNSKGYEQMTERIIESIETCGLNHLSNGELDF